MSLRVAIANNEFLDQHYASLFVALLLSVPGEMMALNLKQRLKMLNNIYCS